MRTWEVTALIFCILVLSACSSQDDFLIGNQVFRPPTIAVTPAPILTNIPAAPSPTTANTPTPGSTPTPSCSNDLTFLEDITVPDGTTVSPGQEIDKHWRIRNSGSCNWNKEYRLQMIAGADFALNPEQLLYPARSNTEAVFNLFFTAPEENGTYSSAWQAFSPQGEPFGDTFFIQVVVSDAT